MKMNEPCVSEKFDMDDIRKIRDYNSSRHIKMKPDEIIKDIEEGAIAMLKLLEDRKKFTSPN